VDIDTELFLYQMGTLAKEVEENRLDLVIISVRYGRRSNGALSITAINAYSIGRLKK